MSREVGNGRNCPRADEPADASVRSAVAWANVLGRGRESPGPFEEWPDRNASLPGKVWFLGVPRNLAGNSSVDVSVHFVSEKNFYLGALN